MSITSNSCPYGTVSTHACVDTASVAPAPTLVGVDTGGTFTDLVILAPDGTLIVRKLPSSPADPSRSVVAGVVECLQDGVVVGDYEVVHGTTVATNALLQRLGVKTAFITTRGFRDMLAIGRQARTNLYSFHPTKPMPLVERSDTHEVTERMDWRGDVLTPVNEEEVVGLLDRLVAEGVEAIAVCFLFAYLNPLHEQLVGKLARERGLTVALSSEIAPEPREYERASTTVANAFVAPLMERYLRRLQEQLEGLRARRLFVMQSNGGVLFAREAAERAVATALSGPAGGVVASIAVGVAAGYPNLITFDMGGTSTDVALIAEGNCPVVTNGVLGELPLRTPQLAIHTVGAGGGSLARLDAGGSLQVGPQSAGADPGPVAYGKGETLTVTDANVLLGRLPADLRLAGRVPLDLERVKSCFAPFAESLRRSPEEAAVGILTVANATMARALRHVSVERGYDPADFALLSFGGAGGLHACALADELKISTILVPRYPGAFSALGLVMADIRREYVQALPPTRLPTSLHLTPDPSPQREGRPHPQPIRTGGYNTGSRASGEGREVSLAGDPHCLSPLPDSIGLRGVLSEIDVILAQRVEALQTQMHTDPVFSQQGGTQGEEIRGPGAERIEEQWFLDLRYVGQSFELRVPFIPEVEPASGTEPAALSLSTVDRAREEFHQLHRQRYGHANPSEPVEVTAVRLVVLGVRPKQTNTTVDDLPAIASFEAEPDGTRPVYTAFGWQDVPVYQRKSLVVGSTLHGPALILQEDATTYLADNWSATVDRHSNLLMRKETPDG